MWKRLALVLCQSMLTVTVVGVLFIFAQNALLAGSAESGRPVAIFTVNSTADATDTNPGDGVCATSNSLCTLRAAIMEANALPGLDTINLPAGTYLLTIPGPDTNGAENGDLDVEDDVTILGVAAEDTIIDGNALGRVMEIHSGTVSISNLTVTNGRSDSGGGVHIGNANVIFISCVIRDNYSSYSGGGLSSNGFLITPIITMIDTEVSGNVANFLGGGIHIKSGVDLAIYGGTIRDNTAGLRGGGLYSEVDVIHLQNLAVSGNGLTMSGGTGGGIFLSSSQATIQWTRVLSNSAPLYGGGIFMNHGNLELADSDVISNAVTGTSLPGGGGGLSIDGFATFTVTNSVIANNTTTGDGGGVRILTSSDRELIVNSVIQDNASGQNGGGVHYATQSASITHLTISNTVIYDNEAVGSGGGIYADWEISLTNTTISDNRAEGSADSFGGGIYQSFTSDVTLGSSTVANNTALSGGGLYCPFNFCSTMLNTIVAFNAGDNCAGQPISLGHNIDSEDSCNFTAAGDLTNTDPLLGPLQDNGGFSFTHALLPGSPAIDAGDESACPLVDQRGYLRPADGDNNGTAICDIGSFEAGAEPPPNYPIYLPAVVR